MTIAFSLLQEGNERENFILKTFYHNAISHPDHTFLLITKNKYNSLSGIKNVAQLAIEKEPVTLFPQFVFYNFQLPKILKKNKAEIFVTENFCSLFSKIPQILVSDLAAFNHNRYTKNKKTFWLDSFLSRSITKATAVITFSNYQKEKIQQNFKINSSKIEVIFPGTEKDLSPVSFEKREATKDSVADGNEYFAYAGLLSEGQNLTNLLKAFSAFKKRQRSQMQLVFAGEPGEDFSNFKNSLDHYKFRNEIKVFPSASKEKILEICSSAYAFIDPASYSNNFQMLFTAMKSEVPVLISSKSPLAEASGDASLSFDAENTKDIAEKMMLIFKDETMRSRLAVDAAAKVETLKWEKSSDALWSNIKKIIGQ
jgi:glycosyltransferase involved in cell wall biosynthesis